MFPPHLEIEQLVKSIQEKHIHTNPPLANSENLPRSKAVMQLLSAIQTLAAERPDRVFWQFPAVELKTQLSAEGDAAWQHL